MASRNQSQWNMGFHNGNKVLVLGKMEIWYDTGSLEIDGSWNLNPLKKKWIPRAEGELLWLDPARYQTKIAWGKPDACKTIPRTDETRQWQAFNSTDGKGIWWWQMKTEEWFLEEQPGAWIKFNDKNNQPHWCHPEGRCFCASVEPWLIEY